MALDSGNERVRTGKNQCGDNNWDGKKERKKRGKRNKRLETFVLPSQHSSGRACVDARCSRSFLSPETPLGFKFVVFFPPPSSNTHDGRLGEEKGVPCNIGIIGASTLSKHVFGYDSTTSTHCLTVSPWILIYTWGGGDQCSMSKIYRTRRYFFRGLLKALPTGLLSHPIGLLSHPTGLLKSPHWPSHPTGLVISLAYLGTPLAYSVTPLAYLATPLVYLVTPLVYLVTPLAYSVTPLAYLVTPLA